MICKTIQRNEKIGTEHKVATKILLIKLLKINFSSQSASKKKLNLTLLLTDNIVKNSLIFSYINISQELPLMQCLKLYIYNFLFYWHEYF